MQIASITVKYVNQPKEGQKKGTIKTTTDEIYGVWPDKLGQFTPGGNYEIEYTTSDYQGKTYKTVTKVNPLGGTGSGGSNGATTKSQEMFVMGIIGRSLQGTGVVPPEDVLAGMVRSARKGWDRGWKDEPEPREGDAYVRVPQQQSFDDEIPF